MFNRKSIYALNKKDPNAIVYTDADGNLIRLTCDDFACAAEFRRWKDWSDSDLRKEENADHNALEQQPIDEDNAKALILQLAAEQYAALGDEEYETNRLRRLFSAFECVAELNADLLKSTVSEVLVTRQNVKLRLKNGQVIERSDLQ